MTTLAAHEWELWSTTARLVVTEPDALAEARVLTDALLADVELAASRFRDDSEIRNLRPGLNIVSALLADLVREALSAAWVTDGAVDPTVGGALARLGYDRDIRLVERNGRNVAVIRPVPGWRAVGLEGSVLTLPPEVDLDLGSTAKASAADRCAAEIASRLGVGVLVSLGGDIATAGPGPGADGGWQIRVADHDDDPDDQISLPPGSAIATSSTVRRTWSRAGERVHHVVDPRTGGPADPVWRSVTVAARDCLTANTASTAAVVKGHAALDWLRGQGLSARLVDRHHRVHLVGGWPRETGDAA